MPRSRFRGLTPDEAVFQKHHEKIDATLRVYDQILSRQKHIAGDVRVLLPFLGLLIELHGPAGAHYG